jgi:hypothetical protein
LRALRYKRLIHRQIIAPAKSYSWMSVFIDLELNWANDQTSLCIEIGSNTNISVWLCKILQYGITGVDNSKIVFGCPSNRIEFSEPRAISRVHLIKCTTTFRSPWLMRPCQFPLTYTALSSHQRFSLYKFEAERRDHTSMAASHEVLHHDAPSWCESAMRREAVGPVTVTFFWRCSSRGCGGIAG